VVEADNDLAGPQSPEHDVLDEGLGVDGGEGAREREHDRGGDPTSAISSRRSSRVVMGDGARAGWSTSTGRGSNVHATDATPRVPARATAIPRISR
jgi:hypothetical protein